MTTGLADIEGIGPAWAEKLEAAGLRTTDDLLRAGATSKGREDLAAATGISGKLILRWVNRADLSRIKGVGEQYADLLEAAGVDTVPGVGPEARGQPDQEAGRSQRAEVPCSEAAGRRPSSRVDRIGQDSPEGGHLLRRRLISVRRVERARAVRPGLPFPSRRACFENSCAQPISRAPRD